MVGGLLLGPLLGLILVSDHPFNTLSYQGITEGKIIDCTSIRSSGSSGKYRRVPVVLFLENFKIRGSTDEVRWIYPCDQRIGDNVPVYYLLEDPSKAVIATFFDTWFYFSLLLACCLIWYPICFFGYRKKLKKSASN